MLKQIINRTLRMQYFNVNIRNITNIRRKEKWDLFAGVLVERLPVITKTLTPMEVEYNNHLIQLEFEQSLKSDHELRYEKDMLQAELLKSGDIDAEFDVDTSLKQTAQDMEDACTEEINKFQFASRKTDNNEKSVKRKLEENLVLLVEQKIGNENMLLLPQGIRQDGENLRQTAERVLSQSSGGTLDVLFYGNSPCGFYKYKYPAGNRQDAVGAKIFFFRSVLKNGNIKDSKIKYEWLDKTELEQKVKKSYFKSVSQFMF